MIIYTGNCPQAVRRDARYSVKFEKGSWVVGIVYNSSNGEYWTPTTKEHPELVRMVNEVKEACSGVPGGSFYINEFRQVIVPAGGEGKYYLAGKYRAELIFQIEDEPGKTVYISVRAEDMEGNPLKAGDEWTNCMMGIPYVLAAGGKDIRFEIQVRENCFRRIPLSRVTDRIAAARLAGRLCEVIGDSSGGRFYINDMREMFKPVTGADGNVAYIYLGHLRQSDPWFPERLFLEE